MLAIAALNLHFHTKPSAAAGAPSAFLEAAIVHGNLALGECGEQLQNLQPAVADSVLTCSRLLCVLGFAFFRVRRQNGAKIFDPESWIWLQNLRGVNIIQISILASNGRINAMIAGDMRPELPPNRVAEVDGLEGATACEHSLYHRVRESRRDGFVNLWSNLREQISSYTTEQAACILHAVEILQEITEHICWGEADSVFRAICTWPCRISPDFIDMLMDSNTSALAVYAHWLVLVVLVEDSWWMGDMGRVGIREIVELSRRAPGDDKDRQITLLSWPQFVLGGDDGQQPNDLG